MKLLLLPLLPLLLFFSCKNKTINVDFDVNSAELLHQNQDQLNQVIIYDVFTPPVASRIYAYTSLAFYEAVRFNKPENASITNQLKGFGTMPLPDTTKKYNYSLAATKAFFNVAHKVIFSIDSLKNYENNVMTTFKNMMDDDEFNRSITFGDAVSAVILIRTEKDNYKKTRGMPKFLGNRKDGRWQPTSPDYADGIEPFWGTIETLVLDSSAQCQPPTPPMFSTDTNSIFFKNAKEVYTIGNNLTDSQKIIVRYWDDNPFVVEHSGHLMFGNKKITPGGHWMGIAGVASKKHGDDLVAAAKSYSVTAIALFDAFIGCWDAKYKTDVIRPITFINKAIDNRWEPFLQTPPFPEYPSGHSAISASASTVLTALYGNDFSFHDDVDKKYIGLEKDFSSFFQAAEEAAVSRVYGGIHFSTGKTGGQLQGKMIGNLIANKFVTGTIAITPGQPK